MVQPCRVADNSEGRTAAISISVMAAGVSAGGGAMPSGLQLLVLIGAVIGFYNLGCAARLPRAWRHGAHMPLLCYFY